MPKVSIVLPNYNYARYLDERIQSLMNQTYQDFELIILDDASTDNSIEVINKYITDSRIKTKFYTENSGIPFKRWNDGAALAQGEYLIFAEADDSCHPTLLEKLVEKLDNHPKVGLAVAQSWEVDSEGRQIKLMTTYLDFLAKGRWTKDFVDNGKNEIQYLLFRNTIPNASAVLMRRHIFDRAKDLGIQLRLSTDWMLWVKMLIISDIAFIAEPLNYFRVHGNTVRSNASKSCLHVEEAYIIQRYILNEIKLKFLPEQINQALDEKAEKWANSLVWEIWAHKRLNLNRHITIYKVASSIDPNLKQRLLLKLAIRFFIEINCSISKRLTQAVKI